MEVNKANYENNSGAVPNVNTNPLSEGELVLIQHLANDQTVREAAGQMGLSFDVAQNNMKVIRAKLGAGSVCAVMAYAFRNSLIQ